MKAVLVLLLLFLGSCGWCQQTPDPLKRAEQQWQAGDLPGATSTVTTALPGLQGEERVRALRFLGEISLEQKQFESSLRYLEEARHLEKQLYGEHHYLTESMLAEVLESLGRLEEAETRYRSTVYLTRLQSVDEVPDTLNNLLLFLHSRGQASAMEQVLVEHLPTMPLFEALETVENLAPTGRDLRPDATLAHSLALWRMKLLSNLGRDAESAEYGRSLLGEMKQDGSTPRNLCAARSNLAVALGNLGRYEEAVSVAESALAVEALDTETRETTLGNLAVLKSQLGDYGGARQLFDKLLELNHSHRKKDDPEVAVTRTNLAGTLLSMGDFEMAYQQLNLALDVLVKSGPAYALTAASAYLGMSEVATRRGDFEDALDLQQSALALRRLFLPEKHPEISNALNLIGYSLENLGRWDEAANHYEQSYQIQKSLAPEHPTNALNLASLARVRQHEKKFEQAEALLGEALQLVERTLPQRHWERRDIHKGMAYLQLARGNKQAARPHSQAALDSLRLELAHILSIASDFERTEFIRKTRPYDLVCQLGEPADILQVSLMVKGRVIDSLISDSVRGRQSDNPKVKQALLALNQERARWSTILSEAKLNTAELRAQLEKIEQLERELAALTGAEGAFNPPSVAELQGQLAAGEALVDYAEYVDSQGETRLGAVVLANSGSPRWTPLCSSQAVAQLESKVRRAGRRYHDAQVTSGAQELAQLLWAPVQKDLPPEVSRVYLSPAGDLNFLAFSVLVGEDGSFLGESLGFTYLVSPRDLLQRTSTGVLQTLTLFGNPDFEKLVVKKHEYPPLPHAEQECRALADVAAEKGYQAKSWLGSAASEARLRTLQSPSILHLATHGYQLPEFGPVGSGVVLSPGEGHDGYCSSVEVASLDLANTDLVVLSACSTGAGEDTGGFEADGLRRAFRQAGVETQVMTLWPVSDETTAAFMVDFYRDLLSTREIEGAFHRTQQAWLKELRTTRGAGAAYQLLGPFVMSR